MPSNADLPFGDSGPVSDIEQPTVSGWPDGAWAPAGAGNTARAAVANNEARTPRLFSRESIVFLQLVIVCEWRIAVGFAAASASVPTRHQGPISFRLIIRID